VLRSGRPHWVLYNITSVTLHDITLRMSQDCRYRHPAERSDSQGSRYRTDHDGDRR